MGFIAATLFLYFVISTVFLVAKINFSDTEKFLDPTNKWGGRALRYLSRTSIAFCLFFVTTANAETLEVPGTGASQLLLRDLARAFEAKNVDLRLVIPHSIGSRGGIRALTQGKTKAARISRSLTDTEKRRGLRAIYFAVSPVVFITHPSVQEVTSVSPEDIVSIYSGNIKSWEPLGGPPRKLYPVTRDSGSVLGAVRAAIEGFPDAKLPIAKPVPSIIDMVEAVQSHPFTIGFSTLNLARSHNVNILKFNDMAADEHAAITEAYPINVRFGLALKDVDDPTLTRFIDFLYSETASAIMRAHGTLPLPRKHN